MVAALPGLTGCAASALDMAPDAPRAAMEAAHRSHGRDQPGPKPRLQARQRRGHARGYVLPPNPALAAIPPPPHVDRARAYTLPDLIDIAESNNPATRIAWDEARSAALAAGIAESAYLPHITASAIGAYQGTSGQQSALGTGYQRQRIRMA